MFAIIDKNNVIRCIASEECNLWVRKTPGDSTEKPCRMPELKDKLDEYEVSIVELDNSGRPGDVLLPDKTIEKHPENYPQPSAEEAKEAKIQAKMQEILRKQAKDELKAAGEI
jgi:hypothetical protein